MTEGKERKSVGNAGLLPAHELFRLLVVATGRPIPELRGGVDLTPEERNRFDSLVNRRLGGEPLQYLEGSVLFAGVELAVDERVLIPRPETEYMTELVALGAALPSVVVDLCTGSGALALAMKRRFPEARVIGTDVSAAALELAAENGNRNRLEVEWLVGDLFDPLPEGVHGRIDLLVANPPYVREADWHKLPADVRLEPRVALVAGTRGTEIIETILNEVAVWTAQGGVVWIEVGDGQADLLAGMYPVEMVNDQYGIRRYLRLSNPGEP